MELSLKHESFKVKMFRFVDVFPMLHGSKSAGIQICRSAAETPGKMQGTKTVIAEMGGKNAIISGHIAP